MHIHQNPLIFPADFIAILKNRSIKAEEQARSKTRKARKARKSPKAQNQFSELSELWTWPTTEDRNAESSES